MSRVPSSRGLAVVTALSATLLAVGGAVVYRPEAILEAAPALGDLATRVEPRVVVLLVGLSLAVLAPTLGITGRLRAASPEPLYGHGSDGPDDRSRYAAAPSRRVVGDRYDRYVDLATAYDDESRETRDEAGERLVESLREIAATAYANWTGLPREEAAASIVDGSWTDDVRAAAFLADEDGPSTPLWVWLVDLVTAGDPYARALERTIDEIDALQSPASEVVG
ncbi:hypothetical protein ACFQGT_19680 [Natrialbaceae archaeon GCM10025810]|uniref:DUF7269 family protein n=1 Tax=Halovalidus salilacus TaxID=3075124 RepID=UPI00360A2BF5